MESRTVALLLCLSILVGSPSVLAAEPPVSDGSDGAQSMEVRYVVGML